jgi:sulfonate transport system permease protein
VIVLRSIALPLALVSIWYGLVQWGLVSTAILPGPGEVFGRAAMRVLRDAEIYRAVAASLQRIFIGWVIAVLIGMALGIIGALSRQGRWILEWPISACRTLPPAAVVPLAILWLGIGDGASIALVAFVAVWPVLINTMAGVENTPRVFREAALTMGANTPQLIATVLLPAALPSVILGMRLAMGLAWMSVVLSELVGVRHGVGALLLSLQQNDDVAAMLVIVFIIGVLGLALDGLFRAMIRGLTRTNRALSLT